MTQLSSGKQPSLLTKQVIRDGLHYLFLGRMRVKSGHLPSSPHLVPANFIGVCVATNPDSAVDDYVVAQVKALGLTRVRLDFTYGDLDNHNRRFLTRLLDEGVEISLHLLPPLEIAKQMHLPEQQETWRAFVLAVLDAFGARISAIEVGNTVNRKRWSGYTLQGFLDIWAIAHPLIKARGITLIGPNVQDFEPFYNISLLKAFQANQQLPDVHSDNLFVERAIEPERFDHRIFKYQWAKWFKYNLVKKARILQKIGHDFGVKSTVSSAAFWAIYRIQRFLPDGQQKQADYAARYFVLLAASGALSHANWGALICQREGLISDGLTEADYPDLERIAHYARADGELSNYQHHASFNAFKTVAAMVQGAQYLNPIATSKGLEIHAFKREQTYFHVAWAINGDAYYLDSLYSAADLVNARMVHRDGYALNQAPLITESPMYLLWKQPETIHVITQAKPIKLHAHVHGQQYFAFKQNGWHGLLLAKHADEAQTMLASLHPDALKAPTKAQALRHARNAIWAVADPREAHQGQYLTVKQPQKMYFHKTLLDRFKPSKAQRSWDGAMELLRRGIATAMPVAYFEKVGDTTLKQNFYVCAFVPSDFNIAQAFVAFSKGESAIQGVSMEALFMAFANFCHTMHARGIYFRDFSGGNILVKIGPDQTLSFSLIDTARLHSFELGAPFNLRIADLTRALNKLHWPGRQRFMQMYLGLSGRQWTWRYRWPFYVYDFKVALKRKFGRKGWKRLVKKMKGQT